MSNRSSLTLALLGAATLALGACQDAPSAPASEPRPLAGPRLTVAYTSVFSFTLNPKVDNVFQTYDGHRLVIPAYSICQVGASGYGPSFWDRTCAPQTLPIVFTIKSGTDDKGRPRVDVFPDVRFSPSKTVSVTFRDLAAANSFSAFIAYCPTGSATCIDESKTDLSLRTYTNPTTGQVTRRIKHFSGYNVILGLGDCETNCDSQEMARLPGLPSVTGASGYITTTGLTGETAGGTAIDR